jgi:hypothetical protein
MCKTSLYGQHCGYPSKPPIYSLTIFSHTEYTTSQEICEIPLPLVCGHTYTTGTSPSNGTFQVNNGEKALHEGRGLYHAPTLGKNPGTDLIGGWVGPRGGLDVLGMIKFLFLPGFEPSTFHTIA